MELDTHIFILLPTELQCETLKQPLTFESVLAIRHLSTYYHNLTTECVKYLEPALGENKAIFPKGILAFPNLTNVYYPIIVESIDDLNSLAHTNLHHAIFDLNALLKTTHHFIGFEDLIVHFIQENPHFNIQTCCPDLEYTFEAKNDWAIIGRNLSFSLRTVPDLILKALPDLLPCSYSGRLNRLISQDLLRFPCLKNIYIDFLHPYEAKEELNALKPLLGKVENIKSYNQPENYSQDLREFLISLTRTYPNIRSFPVTPETEKLAREYFTSMTYI